MSPTSPCIRTLILRWWHSLGRVWPNERKWAAERQSSGSYTLWLQFQSKLSVWFLAWEVRASWPVLPQPEAQTAPATIPSLLGTLHLNHHWSFFAKDSTGEPRVRIKPSSLQLSLSRILSQDEKGHQHTPVQSLAEGWEEIISRRNGPK